MDEIIVNKEELRNNNAIKEDYIKPSLLKLGDLRTLTLGISGAPFDASGGAVNEQTLGPTPPP
jgi:hypothetical protein